MTKCVAKEIRMGKWIGIHEDNNLVLWVWDCIKHLKNQPKPAPSPPSSPSTPSSPTPTTPSPQPKTPQSTEEEIIEVAAIVAIVLSTPMVLLFCFCQAIGGLIAGPLGGTWVGLIAGLIGGFWPGLIASLFVGIIPDFILYTTGIIGAFNDELDWLWMALVISLAIHLIGGVIGWLFGGPVPMTISFLFTTISIWFISCCVIGAIGIFLFTIPIVLIIVYE